MELREALTQITEIRSRLAGAELYRGYRALPVAFSGLVALGAGVVQAVWLEDPATEVGGYLALWVIAAGVSLVALGVEMAIRHWREASPWFPAVTAAALNLFFPPLVCGALVTLVIVRSAPGSVGLLPGLWQVFFSLGIFASLRVLPRPTRFVALFYLGSGCVVLGLAPRVAFAPAAMAVPFCVGQFLAAAILYLALERDGDAR